MIYPCVARGVQNALGGAVVDEEGVLRSPPIAVGDPLEQGDASPQFGPEDLEELLSSASTAKLGHRQTLLVARLLAEDEARAREVT